MVLEREVDPTCQPSDIRKPGCHCPTAICFHVYLFMNGNNRLKVAITAKQLINNLIVEQKLQHFISKTEKK